MADDNLLATFEQSLRQTRQTRTRLATRLAELEAEADKVRTELAEIDTLAGQTEAAMYRILSAVLGGGVAGGAGSAGSAGSVVPISNAPSDAHIEIALQQDAARTNAAAPPSGVPSGVPSGIQRHQQHHPVPHPIIQAATSSSSAGPGTEAAGERFQDRTIPQATAMLLKEADGPLHVNEIYSRLLEGNFQFTGQHPTISIAVSLNRNQRFRKVAPGTFDLVMRDASQAS